MTFAKTTGMPANQSLQPTIAGAGAPSIASELNPLGKCDEGAFGLSMLIKRLARYPIFLVAVVVLNQSDVFSTEQSATVVSDPPKFVQRISSKESNRVPKKSEAAMYDFKGKVDGSVLGDIDNDGEDELVVFFEHRENKWAGTESDVDFALSIYKIRQRGLELLWTDKGELEYRCCSTIVSGEDKLNGIGNINSSGKNYLIIARGVSDVSAPYDILFWENGRLVKKLETNFSSFEGNLSIEGGEIFNLTPVEYQGEKMLKGHLFGVVKSSETLPDGAHHRYVTGGKEVYGYIEDGKFIITDIP